MLYMFTIEKRSSLSLKTVNETGKKFYGDEPSWYMASSNIKVIEYGIENQQSLLKNNI